MPDECYRRHRDVAAVEDEGRWYVAHLPDGPIHCLEGSAAVIWEELPTSTEAAAGRADLVLLVAARAGVHPDAVDGDVADFVARLASLGLLETVSLPGR